jgi:hypothetical protein
LPRSELASLGSSARSVVVAAGKIISIDSKPAAQCKLIYVLSE